MYDQGEILWTPEDVARFEADLAPLDTRLRALAKQFRCRYHLTGARGWPGRQFVKWVWFRTYHLRLMLNPTYLDDGLMHYELREQWMLDYGEILHRVLSHRLVIRFEPNVLTAGTSVVQTIEASLAKALRAR